MALGGINVVPAAQSTGGVFNDPSEPTLIMGADAIHPAPGAEGRPSYTAVVGSVDSLGSKYVASCRAQTSGQEIIDDMEEMTKASFLPSSIAETKIRRASVDELRHVTCSFRRFLATSRGIEPQSRRSLASSRRCG